MGRPELNIVAPECLNFNREPKATLRLMSKNDQTLSGVVSIANIFACRPTPLSTMISAHCITSCI
jgi:hypothetical protein